MERIISKITLNVSGKNAFRALTAKQYDNGVRFIQATMTSDGTPIAIQETDKIIANFRRPRYSTDPSESDYLRPYMGEVIDGEYGVVQVPVEFWVLERSGEVVADISIINAGGGTPQRVTTASFTITVYPANFYTEEVLAASENYDALLMLFKEAEEYKKEITATAQGVIDNAASSEAARRSEYEKLKSQMEAVENEAEESAAQAAQSAEQAAQSATQAAQSADTAGEQARSATSALEELKGTVSDCEAYLESEKKDFEQQAENAAAGIENMVSDFKLWYEQLPEKGIDIGQDYIDFRKLTTFKAEVFIEQTPTNSKHAVNKAYVDNHLPERAMNAYRLNDTYGSLILYDEAYGVKVQSHAGGNWNEGIYIVSSTKNNSFATLTCGDSQKRNLVSLVCSQTNGTRQVDLVWDGDYYGILFPRKSGTFALTSDLELFLTKPEGAEVVYINDGSGAPATVKYSQGADEWTIPQRVENGRLVVGTPSSSAHAATKGYVDGKFNDVSGRLSSTDQRLEQLENSGVRGGSFNIGSFGRRIEFAQNDLYNFRYYEPGDGTMRIEFPLYEAKAIQGEVMCLGGFAHFYAGNERYAPIKVESFYDGWQTIIRAVLAEGIDYSYWDIFYNLIKLEFSLLYPEDTFIGSSVRKLNLNKLGGYYETGWGTLAFDLPMYDIVGREGRMVGLAGYVRYCPDYERIAPVKIHAVFDGWQTYLRVEIENQPEWDYWNIYHSFQELVLYYSEITEEN